jgi:hypothetical protein
MANHDVDFLLDLCEHRLICDCDALEDMACRSVYCGRCPDEVDVCKAAYPWLSPEAAKRKVETIEPWLR